MSLRSAIFLVNLVQDINVLRPLIFMAAREFGLNTEVLVSNQFNKRDPAAMWQRELTEIANDTDSTIVTFENEPQTLQFLQGKGGILLAGSESNLSAHSPTHNVFRLAPPSFLKITLQHGIKCVGFLQNREHDRAHGREVAFAADIVCGWAD